MPKRTASPKRVPRVFGYALEDFAKLVTVDACHSRVMLYVPLRVTSEREVREYVHAFRGLLTLSGVRVASANLHPDEGVFTAHLTGFSDTHALLCALGGRMVASSVVSNASPDARFEDLRDLVDVDVCKRRVAVPASRATRFLLELAHARVRHRITSNDASRYRLAILDDTSLRALLCRVRPVLTRA